MPTFVSFVRGGAHVALQLVKLADVGPEQLFNVRYGRGNDRLGVLLISISRRSTRERRLTEAIKKTPWIDVPLKTDTQLEVTSPKLAESANCPPSKDGSSKGTLCPNALSPVREKATLSITCG